MGVHHLIFIFLSLSLLQIFISPTLSLPLCTDSRAPFTPKTPLAFCSYNQSSCCNSAQDSDIRKRFELMNVSRQDCASLLKSILCSQCDPFSAELFTISTGRRQVPVLCSSTASSQTNQSTNNFCKTVWDSCQNVPIENSPLLQGQAPPAANTTTKLTDIWPSSSTFCSITGEPSTNASVCFNGEKTIFNTTTTTTNVPKGLCLERIGNDSFIDMAAYNDGSSRALFANQKGQIWLATIPEPGSGGSLHIDESNPYLDLTDEVHFDTATGLMSIAIHPNFTSNGRFFASFNCDKSDRPGCAGRCACNSDVNCDPAELEHDNGVQPCQYQAVVAEYNTIPSVSAEETRRIFTMGLPYTGHHGGQILFGPDDGYLYFMMGDGGGVGDPQNFSQNKRSLLGKIMRLDVDNIPSEEDISRLALWGNYSIPKDNPYTKDNELLPEIWALGLRNPWRCSFDSERSSYFICGDIGQDEYEEVNLIMKDGNYGWRLYEGPGRFSPLQMSGRNSSVGSINPIFPVTGYSHYDLNKKEGSASITGGLFYRSNTDPCMYGSYLYADLYATAMWAATEMPKDSGNFTSSKIPFTCASDSPLPCSIVPGSSLPSLGYIFSFGQDNNKDVYLLTSSGVYRVVAPSRCSYACAIEKTTTSPNQQSSSSPLCAHMLKSSANYLTFLLVSTIVFLFIGLNY
ncbi:putative quinoprotein glucose dehydrogenase (PQQ, quinone) [Helianthus annuus]|nr:putative quinoprotein glucose dehydrogenase (PQQ, quinone) [Helianthus annuus]